MRKLFNTNITGILFLSGILSLAIGQERLSIHLKELEIYQDAKIDFQNIDNSADVFQPMMRDGHLTHQIIGYLPYWMYEVYPNLRYELLSQINYFSAELNPLGEIINAHGWPDIGFIYYAQERGVKVKLTATLFGSEELTELLSNPQNRSNAVTNLINLMVSGNGDGIDIDFELMPSSQKENMVLFVEELKNSMEDVLSDPILTIATPPIDWSNAWDYAQLGELADGLFIMGYNFHWSGSATAGPIAPLDGFYFDLEYSVDDYISEYDGIEEKLILGLPYYGYNWSVADDQIYSVTIGNGSALTYANATEFIINYGSVWDYNSNSPWISYFDYQWQQVWFDDSESLTIKYNYAKERDLAGVGMWALGYDGDHQELWQSLENVFYCSANGDLNEDLELNILDVILLVNLILEITELNDSLFCRGDLNLDGTLNILDIIELVNLILT